MFRRRFKLSRNNVGDGVYAVNKNLRLIPVSEADNTCIAVALVYDRHRIMIEKFGELNQSYKETTEGYINSTNYLLNIFTLVMIIKTWRPWLDLSEIFSYTQAKEDKVVG